MDSVPEKDAKVYRVLSLSPCIVILLEIHPHISVVKITNYVNLLEPVFYLISCIIENNNSFVNLEPKNQLHGRTDTTLSCSGSITKAEITMFQITTM